MNFLIFLIQQLNACRLQNPIQFVVVLGGPGSGKTTMSQKLCENHQSGGFWLEERPMTGPADHEEAWETTVSASRIAHLSAGALLRHTVKKRGRHWLQIDTLMRDGELVPDHIICSVIAAAIVPIRYHHPNGIVLLDGFPLSENQAQLLDTIGVSHR